MTNDDTPSQPAGTHLTQAPIGKLLVQMAAPAAIGFLFATLYNLVDSFWANRLGASLDTSAPVDALGAGTGYFLLMLSFAIGLNQGATAMMTNALGEGDKDKARNSFFQTLALALGASVALALAGLVLLDPILTARFPDQPEIVALAGDYLIPIYICAFTFILSFTANAALAAQGDFKTLGMVQVLGFFLNLVLDPLFMFGWGPVPAMGIFGLAVATILINVVGMGIILTRVLRSPMFDGFDPKAPGISMNGIGDLIRQAVPAMLNMAVIGVGYIVITELLNAFGPGAMGGVSNAMRLEQLILLPVIGLQIAVMAIIGTNNGARRFDRVAETFRQAMIVALVIMGSGMVLVWIFHDMASGLFAAGNADIHRMSNLYMLYSSVALMAYAIVLIGGGVLQGLKQPFMPLFINIVRQIIAPIVAFGIGVQFFETPNIHVSWAGTIGMAWVCAIFTYFYVQAQIRKLGR